MRSATARRALPFQGSLQEVERPLGLRSTSAEYTTAGFGLDLASILPEMDLANVGRTLILMAALLAVVGVLLLLGSRVPLLGRLPGDLNLRWGETSIYVPIVTCLVVSVVLSLLINLVGRFFR